MKSIARTTINEDGQKTRHYELKKRLKLGFEKILSHHKTTKEQKLLFPIKFTRYSNIHWRSRYREDTTQIGKSFGKQ